jgi:hypothetical protein
VRQILAEELQPSPKENAIVDPPGVQTVMPGKPTIPWTEWFDIIYDWIKDRVPTIPIGSTLDPSESVQTDSNGELVTISNTGTGDNVLSDSPTITTLLTSSGTNVLSGLTYPTSDGTAGQAIVTDGAGVLGWAKNLFDVEAGITASTTQTQAGGYALTKSFNEIATVANDGDAVTMPSASAAEYVRIVNNGANDLQVFPASGDGFNGESVDASITIKPETTGGNGTHSVFWAKDGTTWEYVNMLTHGYGSVSNGSGHAGYTPTFWSAENDTAGSGSKLVSADQIDSNFLAWIDNKGSTVSNGVDIRYSHAGSNGIKLEINASNTSTTADAMIDIDTAANTTNGDPHIRFGMNGGSGTRFCVGRDTRDTGDPFKITYGSDMQDTSILEADTAGKVTIPAELEVDSRDVLRYAIAQG